MAEPFKNLFNRDVIDGMGTHFVSAWPEFDSTGFVSAAMNNLQALELKQRSAQITQAMATFLPTDFENAARVILDSLAPEDEHDFSRRQADLSGLSGWAIMPMADVVAAQGLHDFDHGLNVLAQMTKRFSAEFAIRHFFLHDCKAAMKKAMIWAEDDNFHVRRLASEGSRPRLPWGLQIQSFVHDPAPLIPLLERLKGDTHEYVRRSVSNNLNDIAKDHPDIVAGVASDWMKGADKNTQRIVRHACRTLIKRGHQPPLKALGYGKPQIELSSFEVTTPIVKLGQGLNFSVNIRSTAKTTQPLILDFVIHHRLANGSTSPKTFKWKNLTLASGEELELAKTHPVRPITTRTFYPGQHGLEIQVNGEIIARAEFELNL